MVLPLVGVLPAEVVADHPPSVATNEAAAATAACSKVNVQYAEYSTQSQEQQGGANAKRFMLMPHNMIVQTFLRPRGCAAAQKSCIPVHACIQTRSLVCVHFVHAIRVKFCACHMYTIFVHV